MGTTVYDWRWNVIKFSSIIYEWIIDGSSLPAQAAYFETTNEYSSEVFPAMNKELQPKHKWENSTTIFIGSFTTILKDLALQHIPLENSDSINYLQLNQPCIVIYTVYRDYN